MTFSDNDKTIIGTNTGWTLNVPTGTYHTFQVNGTTVWTVCHDPTDLIPLKVFIPEHKPKCYNSIKELIESITPSTYY